MKHRVPGLSRDDSVGGTDVPMKTYGAPDGRLTKTPVLSGSFIED